MKLLYVILKILLMLGFVCLMAAPLFLEYLSFRKDKEKKITYKRFRLLVFSVVYFIAITVVMVFLKDLLLWIQSWSVIQWISGKISIPARFDYGVSVFAVIALNFGIGVLFKFLLKLVRIGLKKKTLVDPKGKDGEFTWRQKAERAVLKFFHDEKWFFAGKILKFLCITLSAVYAVLFLAYQLPVFFGASWIPYSFLLRVFEAGYVYPVITLLPLWQAYFFLAGVELLEEECPELVHGVNGTAVAPAVDLKKVNEDCKKLFKNYFVCEIKGVGDELEVSSTDYHEITKIIAEGVSRDERNPQSIKEGYLKCIDTIVRNDLSFTEDKDEKLTRGVLVNGGFFTEFSMYFLRYVSVILSRGDNVVFVCNDDAQIDEVYSYVNQAFSELYSLYGKDAAAQSFNFDDPVWRICRISGDKNSVERSRIDDCSVLITDLKYLCSSDFEKNHVRFANLIDTVVFVDAMRSVNTYPRHMSLFNTSVKNTRDVNGLLAKNSSENKKRPDSSAHGEGFAVRYTSNQIKYVCFDDSRTPGIDKVLKNLLSVDFVSADAMKYSPATVMCCYNYDGRVGDNGRCVCPQNAKTLEELGVLVNMADASVMFGCTNVALFADQNVPYADFSESVAANANNGIFVRENKNLFINTPYYNPDNYKVIVAFDTDDNLPAAVRRYAAMTPQSPSLVMIFSRPYLLRDYYAENIEELWKPEQIMRIPVEQSSKQNAINRILVKASAGGITESEIFAILKNARLPDYKDVLEAGELNAVLKRILEDCGNIHQNSTLDPLDFFEYNRVRDFDKNGLFVTEDRICLRKRGVLYDYICGRNMVRLITDGDEMLLPLPRERLSQNFIAGQNMLYNGCVYIVNHIDNAEGKLYIKHATGGTNNVPYQYIQDREYHIVWSDETAESVYAKTCRDNGSDEGILVSEINISVKRRPMEVITKGYTPVDPHTLSMNCVGRTKYEPITGDEHIDKFKQTYRKYGIVENPVCSSDAIMDSKVRINASANGALVMSVRISGNFGDDTKRISTLAAAMLGEIFRSMFPSVADSIAVCPVVSEPFTDKESLDVLKKQPKVYCRGYTPDPKDIEILIIEDCELDLGVLSVLMSSGDNAMKVLFSPVFKYLEWYAKANEKSTYLYYGNDTEPACFDFEGLRRLSGILGADSYSLQFQDAETIARYDVCDFCGKRFVKGPDVTVLPDGRKMCRDCAAGLVNNDKKTLKMHLERAKIFLESTYGISIDDDYEFCFESTVKIANALKQNRNLKRRGTDIPLKSYVDGDKKVYVEYELPSVNLSELLVRELTHVWQLKHLPDLAEDLAEGHIALVAIQYLRFLGQHSIAAVRTSYYESTRSISGEGYRKLVRELLANPKYRNNPFLYLLDLSGQGGEDNVIPPEPKITETGEYGLPYTPEAPDRALDGNITYFYYSRLTPEYQKAYDAVLDAVVKHEDKAPCELGGCDPTKLRECIQFDHPELFWFERLSYEAGAFVPKYCATAEEAADLQQKIDAAVPAFLDGIDDSMSAYDVALRLHVKVINMVDYDTITLTEEKKRGGPESGKIDYLRTICGVFINGKAVCEGYARAMQYLLQKCGVECAEAAGYVVKDDGSKGGGHAWHILKIDGDYYYMDTTWDDGSNTVQTVKNTDFGFDYFCITTKELLRTRDLAMCPIEVPDCTATRANYYHHNGLAIDSYDLSKLKQIAQTAAKSKQKFFAFKCTSKSVYEDTMAKLFTAGNDCYETVKAASKIDKKISPSSYSYSHNPKLWTITVKFVYS